MKSRLKQVSLLLGPRGMSLVSVVTAMAVGAVLVAAMTVLYTNMTEMRVKNELTHDADSLTNWLQDLLNNPAICATALRTGTVLGGAPISWDVGTTAQQPVGHIEVVGSGLVAAYTGQILLAGNSAASPRLKLTSMFLRQPDPSLGVDEGRPALSVLHRKNAGAMEDLNMVAAKLVLTFNGQNNILTSAGIDRKINLTLGFEKNSPFGLKLCYQTGAVANFNAYCNTVNSGNPPCPTPNPGCEQWYYISGFDPTGTPSCACAILCSQPPVGPPGKYKAGTGTGGTGKNAGN